MNNNLRMKEADLDKRSFTQKGDVVQINEIHGRMGWIGAFVLVTDVRDWGIVGFVHHIETHDNASRAYIRLKWDEVDYIGRAVLTLSEKEQ
jgi:hypothetical protein